MSTLAEWVQDALFSHAEFVPCDMDQPCENCDHPLRSHFNETPNTFATGCGVCSCQHWCCRHGGVRTR